MPVVRLFACAGVLRAAARRAHFAPPPLPTLRTIDYDDRALSVIWEGYNLDEETIGQAGTRPAAATVPHTPGPWQRQGTTIRGTRNDLGRQGVIADTALHHSSNVDMQPEHVANARAIAALPEFIRVCQVVAQKSTQSELRLVAESALRLAGIAQQELAVRSSMPNCCKFGHEECREGCFFPYRCAGAN